MKLAMVLGAASAMMLTGCSDLISLNPFVPEQDAVVDPTLAGTWKNSDGMLVIVQQEQSAYSITYTENKETAKFNGRLAKMGDAEIMDLVLESDDAFQVPVHMMARVWVEGSTLRWIFLDSKWLRQQAAELAGQPSGNRTLLTSPEAAARAFAWKYAGDARAYEGDPSVMTR